MPSFPTDLGTDVWITCAVSAVAAIAVLVPFARGLAFALRARTLTRRLEAGELRARLAEPASAGEPFALATLRVLHESLAEDAEERHPTAFLRDATKQYMLNEYDAAYAQPMAMFANVLPPVGFIGTTAGLAALLVSMHLADGAMQLGALALALGSTIFALICFAILEFLKIALYRRMMGCLDDALGFRAEAPATALEPTTASAP